MEVTESDGGNMEYFMTKEYGTGWSESLAPTATAWGVSDSQRRLAKKIAPGNIFLHYIDYAHAWAGFSTVTAVLQENQRDSHADWLAALPHAIPIERGVWLTEGQCERTVSVPGLPDKNYNRQAAFTRIQEPEAHLIIAAIQAAASVQQEPSPEFHARWTAHAESYYKGIVISLADGKCRICGDDVAAWARRAKTPLSDKELEKLRDSFLDAAHIVADSKSGPMTPDNLRALCPSCHRVVDRLSDERRVELMRNVAAGSGD